MKRLQLLILVSLLLTCSVSAQTSFPVSIEIGTNPFAIANRYMNACIRLKGRNVLRKFSMCSDFEFGGRRIPGSPLTQEISSHITQLEIAYFPFIYKKTEAEGCNSNFKKVKKYPGQFLLSGLYLASGFQHLKTEIDLRADPLVEAPIQHFHADVVENSLTFFSGVHYRLPVLSFGVAYGCSLGQPRMNDPWHLLSDTVYTTTYPVKFRFNHGLRAFIGINF